MKQILLFMTAVAGAFLLQACETHNLDLGGPVVQTEISRISQMPQIPSPYKMLDWKQKALDFDAYVFNEETRLFGKPVLWYDNACRNSGQTTFGLYTAVNDVRQGPEANHGEFHESLNTITALIGSTLVGIDKTFQNGKNYVKMVQNYFNTDNGWNIIMNNTCPEVALLGGGYGRDWWYDVFPNVLYYALCDLYPEVEGAEKIQRTIAEQFCKADSVLAGNYNYSYFDYSNMEGMTNNIPCQQDAAGGHAWVLYSAYRKFGDQRYLDHAVSAMQTLLSQEHSRFYEILLPMSAITAARLNAEQGMDLDVKKIIDWTFDGCSDPTGRNGWGVISERWGDYDVHGLQGSLIDGGGYAFFMNSVKLSWPLVPMVKYETQFAAAIGKWMLNLANACRLFYPTEIDDNHQWLPEMKNVTNGNIAYEGLRKYDKYGKPELKDMSPVALGDGPDWGCGNPPESMFSIYSTSPVGILGAIVATTDVEAVLKLDCNATDFYADRTYPEYLMYNPHDRSVEVTYETSRMGQKNPRMENKTSRDVDHDVAYDLFDVLSRTYLAENLRGTGKITIPARQAVLITELPAGTDLHLKNGHIVCADENETIISYN